MLRELSAGSAVAIRSINETGRGRKAGPVGIALGQIRRRAPRYRGAQ